MNKNQKMAITGTRLFTSLLRASLVVSFTLPLTGCFFAKQDGATISKSGSGFVVPQTTSFGARPEDDVPTSTGVASVANFEQISGMMSTVTGVTPDNTINTFVRNNLTALPATGVHREVSPVSVNTTIQLAGLYCERLITAEAAAQTRRVFTGINFTNTGNQSQLSSGVRDQVCQSLATQFWQRSASAQECSILNDAMDEAIEGRPSSQAELRFVLRAVCVASLASLQTLSI